VEDRLRGDLLLELYEKAKEFRKSETPPQGGGEIFTLRKGGSLRAESEGILRRRGRGSILETLHVLFLEKTLGR